VVYRLAATVPLTKGKRVAIVDEWKTFSSGSTGCPPHRSQNDQRAGRDAAGTFDGRDGQALTERGGADR
jgi:hypothetical protein